MRDAVIRPDMRLINNNLDKFEVGFRDQPVTFDSLIAIYQEWRGTAVNLRLLENSFPSALRIYELIPGGRSLAIVSMASQDRLSHDREAELEARQYENETKAVTIRKETSFLETPLSVLELVAALTASGMTELLEASPVDILDIACRRTGSKGRVSSLFSTIGIVAPSSTFESITRGQNDLVLGMYPLWFLETIRSSIGAAFFATKNDGMLTLSGNKCATLEGCGSMLPFWGTSNHRWRPEDMKDHQSVSSWQIKLDGSVYIPMASIWISTDVEEYPASAAVTVFLDPVVSGLTLISFMDFRDFDAVLRSFLAKLGFKALHAVVLLQSKTRCEGVIVGQVGQYMIKTGHFASEAKSGLTLPIPESTQVDWMVL